MSEVATPSLTAQQLLASIKNRARRAMEHMLFNVQDAQDWLAERADIVGYCRREGLNGNPRLTGRL